MTHRWNVIAAAVLIAQTANGTQAQEVPFENRISDRAVLYAHIPSVPEFKKRLDQCSWGRLAADPSMAEFREAFSERLAAQAIATGLFPEGTPLEEILSLPAGQAGLVILPPAQQTLPAVVFLDFGEARDRVNEIIATTQQRLQDADWELVVSEANGTQIRTFNSPMPDPSSDGGIRRRRNRRQSVALAVRDTTLLVGSTTRVVEGILNRWEGTPEKSLGANPVFVSLSKQTRQPDRVPAAVWFFDPVRLIDELLKQAGNNFTINMVRGTLTQLGISQIRGAAGAIDMNVDSYDTIHRVAVRVDDPDEGVASLLLMPASDLTPPFWVPARATTCVALNWDGTNGIESARKLVDRFLGDGQFQRLIDQLKTRRNAPKLDLETDVFPQYSCPIHIVRSPYGDSSADPPPEAVVLSVGVHDGGKMSTLIARLIEEGGRPHTSRTFQGATIHSVEAAVLGTLHVSVAHNTLLLSNKAGLLEEVIAASPEAPGLSASDLYRRSVRRMPKEVSLLSFQDAAAQLRSLYIPMRRAAQLNPDRSPLLNLLPAFEKVEPYLLPGISYVTPTESGFQYVSVTLAETEESGRDTSPRR